MIEKIIVDYIQSNSGRSKFKNLLLYVKEELRNKNIEIGNLDKYVENCIMNIPSLDILEYLDGNNKIELFVYYI